MERPGMGSTFGQGIGFNRQPKGTQAPGFQQQPQQQPRSVDMSAYAPGRAQSIQPQSEGTRYRQPEGGARRPEARGGGERSQGSSERGGGREPYPGSSEQGGGGRRIDSGFSPYQMPAGARPGFDYQYASSGAPFGPSGGQPNLLPPPSVSGFPQGFLPTQGFQTTSYGLDGTPMSQGQFHQQRDALIQLLNDDNARYQMQSGTGDSFGPAPQAPDIQSLWRQAGDMVAGGWRNPLLGGMAGDVHPSAMGRNLQSPYPRGPNGGAILPDGREVWF